MCSYYRFVCVARPMAEWWCHDERRLVLCVWRADARELRGKPTTHDFLVPDVSVFVCVCSVALSLKRHLSINWRAMIAISCHPMFIYEWTNTHIRTVSDSGNAGEMGRATTTTTTTATLTNNPLIWGNKKNLSFHMVFVSAQTHTHTHVWTILIAPQTHKTLFYA